MKLYFYFFILFSILTLSSCYENKIPKPPCFINNDVCELPEVLNSQNPLTHNYTFYSISIDSLYYSEKILLDLNCNPKNETAFDSSLWAGMYFCDNLVSIEFASLEDKKVRYRKTVEFIKSMSNIDHNKPDTLFSNNYDTVAFELISYLHNMDRDYRLSGKSNESLLLLVGNYIETLYLATQSCKYNKSEYLKDYIGEQKFALSQIIKVLDVFQNNNFSNQLRLKLEGLALIYEDVELRMQKNTSSSTDPETGIRVVATNCTSEVIMKDSTLNRIIETTEQIRDFYIKLE